MTIEYTSFKLNFPHLKDVDIFSSLKKSKNGDFRGRYIKPRLLIGDVWTNCCLSGVPSPHIDESRTKGMMHQGRSG